MSLTFLKFAPVPLRSIHRVPDILSPFGAKTARRPSSFRLRVTSRVTMTASRPTPSSSTEPPSSPSSLSNRTPIPQSFSSNVVSMQVSPTDRPLYAVAPMMDVTDRHYRALARLISRRATLYTEMVVDRTLIHNPKLRILELRVPDDPSPQPVVLQLGGSDPRLMSDAIQFAADHPYSEININCGCPSPKVADNGCFGAALMRSPALVASITRGMAAKVDVPVTVKCRLGLDWDTSYEPLYEFIRVVHEFGGVTHFIVHARNAVLGGLSPAQNRSVPPLRYDVVYRLIDDFPHLRFSINGGIKTIDDVLAHLERGVHGVMVGRAAMDAPWHALCEVDARVYGTPNMQMDGSVTTRRHVLHDYKRYARREIEATTCSSRAIVKPLLNLFHGERNGKMWRRALDEGLRSRASVDNIIDNAMAVLPKEVLDALPGQKVVALYTVGDERCSDNRVIEQRPGLKLQSAT